MSPAVGRELLHRRRARQVERVDRDLHAVRGFEVSCRALSIGSAVAGGEMQMAAFGGEHLGDREPDALRGAGDQRRLVCQLQFHTHISGRKSRYTNLSNLHTKRSG